MLFNSFTFALFLPTVYCVYWLAGAERRRLQNLILLIASYVFYGWWDARFLSLIILSSAVDYWVGLRLHRCEVVESSYSHEDTRRVSTQRRALLAVSLIVNLGVLGLFKYYDFFAESARACSQWIGWDPGPLTLNLILPMGISFYTLQTLSYTIDIYRRQLTPCRDPLTFFTFVSFFPQLVAGPIERARHLLPQFESPRSFDPEGASDGLRRILWGFIKKTLLADNLAPIVAGIFTEAPPQDALQCSAGVLLFSFQLYFDFSGYSDMAIGFSKLFGVHLRENFRSPYLSQDMSSFWKRWHISLSEWFRDYLYIPLGGNRVALTRQVINVLIVFGVSGLWHGASWLFVVWGLLNGLYLVPKILETSFKGDDSSASLMTSSDPLSLISTRRPRLNALIHRARACVNALSCLFLWSVALIFFRSQSWSEMNILVSRILSSSWGHVGDAQAVILLWACACLLFIEACTTHLRHPLDIAHWPQPLRWSLYIVALLTLLLWGSLSPQEFVYFQF